MASDEAGKSHKMRARCPGGLRAPRPPRPENQLTEPEFREVIVLREIEGLSYKEIASVLAIPMGTVMSRLSRARNLLLVELGGTKLDGAGEVQHDLP